MSVDPRALIYVNDQGITDVKIEDLELMSLETSIKEWVPTRQLQPYEELTKVYVDIETTGLLNNDNNIIIMIGLRVSRHGEPSYNTILAYQNKDGTSDEKAILEKFNKEIEIINPHVLIGHNLFDFDLPFIIKRCNFHDIPNKLTKLTINRNGEETPYIRTITASNFHGKPIQYQPIIYGQRYDKPHQVQILDTLQQICVWDKTANKLKSYGLKPSVIALKLREDKRLELNNDEIQNCYKTGDYKTLSEYLVYDLEDTELLANFLLPIVYYQLKIILNISFQDLATASPAKKIQLVHEKICSNKSEVTTDEKEDYIGALVTLHNPGIHKDVAKIDVGSLYPSIMLRYGVCSRKDQQKKFLSVLQYMTTERLKLKKLAKEGNLNADHMQNALKVLINGSYGFFGTGGYSFNDMQAAALVTAYGRKIFMMMESLLAERGAVLIESDTDGIIFSHPEPEKMLEIINKCLPSKIKCDLDFSNCVASVPKKKNYIIIRPDGKSPIIKGAKRTELPIIQEFRIEYIKRYAYDKNEAEVYYINLIDQINSGNYVIDKLTIERRIGKAEKKLVELGLGEVGKTTRYWYSFRLDSKYRKVPVETNSAPYYAKYYVDKITETKYELLNEIAPKDDGGQLSFDLGL